MCGLTGIVSFAGPPVDAADIAAMRDRMTHRGPDAAGIWVSSDRSVGLGLRRLSIIDLSSAADQPMANEDGSIQVVFNGAIYNHAEIRAELEGAGGHVWRTNHSDTEVIVHAYEQWGIECIHRFRGMFAIAVWDGRARVLHLVRDRSGVKPLYFARLAGRIAFASEIKALLALAETPRRINEESLFHYLSFLTTPPPRTMFAGIEKLAAATRVEVDATGAITVQRYWDPLANTTPLLGVDEREIAERLRAELTTAVRYRTVSDVPVGVFLSGGIDSSVAASLIAQCHGPVRTFSIGYEGSYTSCRDELTDARTTAGRLGAEHVERRLTMADMLDALDAIVYHHDEPNGDAVSFPVYCVAKLAREAGVSVCQVGEGSDELFCGYPSWLRHLRVANLDASGIPSMARHALLNVLATAGRSGTYSYEVLRRSAHGEPTFWGGAEGLTSTEKQNLLGADLAKRLTGLSSADVIAPIRQRFLESSWDQAPLQWMTYLDLTLRLPELLLMRLDKMAMASSVEGRVPFLDHRLVELALSIPSAVKVRNQELKHILKLAIRGLVPDDVIDRPKQGFAVPMREWMPRGLGAVLSERITRFADDTGLLDPVRVREYLPRAEWSKVWLLYNLAAWHARFVATAA